MLESEGNDFPSSANRLNLGETVNGALSTKSDWDYFEVTAGSAGVLKVDFTAPTASSSFYFNVTVYDSSQKILASDFLGSSASFSLGVPSAGKYYISVTSSSLYSAAQYGVTVSMATGSAGGFERESNNTLATASAIILDQTIKGQLASSQDADYYRVVASTAGVLVVDFAAPVHAPASANTTFTLGVYDAAGKLVQSRDTGNALTLGVAVPAPGDYYLKITQANSYDGGNYSLTAHNDGFPTLAAKALAGVGSVPLTLNTGRDWYSVDLAAGSTYQFKAAGADSGGGTLADPSLLLHYSNGAFLESSDNLAVWSNGKQTTVADPQIAFTAPSTGTYYLMVGGNGGSGTLTLSVNTDAVSALANDLLLLQGDLVFQGAPNYRWNGGAPLGTPVSLSYAFLTATADNEPGFVAMTPAQQQVVKSVLDQYSSVANITFNLVSDPTLAQIRFGTSNQSNSAGVTYIAENGAGALEQADVFIDNSVGSAAPAASTMVAGGYGLLTLIHEVGHALGLKHPGNYDAGGNSQVHGPYLPAALDNEKFSTMSYLDNPDSSVYHDTPGVLDIAAVQYLYGANNIGSGQAHTFSFNNSNPFVSSLLSSGMQGTLDISNQSLGSTIFLTPGALSSIGVGANGGSAHDNVAIPFGMSVVNVIDGPAADLIVGNTLDNKFFGFSVGDTLDGGGGSDTLVLSGASSGLNNAADNQLQNIQTVDARSASAGIQVDLHAQNESISIVGGSHNDTLTASTGGGLIVGGGGNDVINGGIGRAAAGYSGTHTGYAVSKTASGLSVRDTVGADGTDTLIGIERLQFSDVKLAFDVNGSAGNTARFIGAAFGVDYLSNTPANNVIKGQGLAVFDAGTTMQQLAAAIVKSPVFINLEGTNSNTDFVKFIFKNVIGQTATTDQVSSLLTYLDNGMTQGDFLATVANLDANAQHVGLAGLAGTGLEYL